MQIITLLSTDDMGQGMATMGGVLQRCVIVEYKPETRGAHCVVLE